MEAAWFIHGGQHLELERPSPCEDAQILKRRDHQCATTYNKLLDDPEWDGGGI